MKKTDTASTTFCCLAVALKQKFVISLTYSLTHSLSLHPKKHTHTHSLTHAHACTHTHTHTHTHTLTTYQWQIVHRIDNHALILWCVFSNASQPRLHHIMSVQKLLFSAGLQPNLVLKQDK